ncbi:zinc finger matrin-type protein 5 isoform 1-T3 [Amazona ochrocephala]
MGKRYFCDYCDRSFQDNLHNRKKHLNGVQHLRAKRAWYDLFRDAAAILQEEQTKKPCRKFLQTGQCDFGSNCRFSHMTEQDLEKLSAQVQGEQRSKELQQEGADVPPGTIEDWLEKRAKRLSAAQSNRDLLAGYLAGSHGWSYCQIQHSTKETLCWTRSGRVASVPHPAPHHTAAAGLLLPKRGLACVLAPWSPPQPGKLPMEGMRIATTDLAPCWLPGKHCAQLVQLAPGHIPGPAGRAGCCFSRALCKGDSRGFSWHNN